MDIGAHYKPFIDACRTVRQAVFMVNALPPVTPDAAALRVEKCPAIDASLVDKRSWPRVSARGEEPEV